MPSANNDQFASPFKIHIRYIYFSCTVSLIMTTNAMVNWYITNRHLCLLPGCKGPIHSLPPPHLTPLKLLLLRPSVTSIERNSKIFKITVVLTSATLTSLITSMLEILASSGSPIPHYPVSDCFSSDILSFTSIRLLNTEAPWGRLPLGSLLSCYTPLNWNHPFHVFVCPLTDTCTPANLTCCCDGTQASQT